MNIGGRAFIWGARTYIMGILNVTPDSFSGDGVLSGHKPTPSEIDQAVAHALEMEADGADIIDVGGESSRPVSVYPNVAPISAGEELSRVMPIIDALLRKVSVPISIDTRKALVAKEALQAGAHLVNDVSMLGDIEMSKVVANFGVPIVVSHIRPTPKYEDIIANILDDMDNALVASERSGLKRDMVIADPGIGFAKHPNHSIQVIRRLSEIKRTLDLPILVGVSRKSFIGHYLGGLPIEERLEGTAATAVISILNGADIVRVHDVKQISRAARMADVIVRRKTGDL